jgi:DeoR family suf operon transcriptional repressor
MQPDNPRSAILDFLRRKDSSVDELSAQLRISASATRQHLSILERDGLIQRTSVKERVGRPKVYYSLTEKAEAAFPKAYAHFARWLLADMLEREGEETVRALLGRLGTLHASYYQDRVTEDGDVEAVVELLNELGAYAALKREDGHVVIQEYNCLIYEMAMAFGDIVCEFNLKFIGSLLKSPVEQTSCIAHGDCCCSFVVEASNE